MAIRSSLQRGTVKKAPVDPAVPKEKIYPKYTCPKCHCSTQLDFDPLHSGLRFDLYVCPHCHKHKESTDYRNEIEAIRLKHKKGGH